MLCILCNYIIFKGHLLCLSMSSTSKLIKYSVASQRLCDSSYYCTLHLVYMNVYSGLASSAKTIDTYMYIYGHSYVDVHDMVPKLFLVVPCTSYLQRLYQTWICSHPKLFLF